MARNALARAGLAACLMALLPACEQARSVTDTVTARVKGLLGGKEAEPEVDMAAVRARRDSIRQAQARDSLARVRYETCADSVKAVLAKAAARKPGKGKKAAAPALPEGMIPPEVLQACGRPPAMPRTVAKADSGAPPAAPGGDSAGPGARPGAAAPTAAPAGAARDSAKPALTPKQQQVLRADSIRQVAERAKADSLRHTAESRRQDSVARASRDSTTADSLRGARETEVLRETFTYAGGARDPFTSLMGDDQVGPDVNDLTLVGIYLDLRRASNSVAVMRDEVSKKRYKLRPGERVGRLKVSQIRQGEVVFTIEDIGFERQETLRLRKREDETP